MNILIVLAHPNHNSLNYSIANLIKEQKEAQGYSVKMIDLYKENRQDFFTFENSYGGEIEKDEKTIYHQELISWADNISFVFPYWWGSEPAILHNWIDSNFLPNFAFKYTNGMPKGMLQKRTVTIYTTSGTPKFLCNIMGGHRRLKRRWKKGIVEFCGMKLDGFYAFGGVDTSKEKAEKILKDVEKRVTK
jgi:NAD(P)H dehydrogenase (quinone)